MVMPGDNIKITVELISAPDDFAVRAHGSSPDGPHAVCFGQLIVARTPLTGDFNWAELLTHELSHAFTLAMSGDRVPRWLGEGLADRDASLARPEWRREYELALWGALEAGSLPPISQLDQSFAHPETLDALLLSYAYSQRIVAFLAELSGEGVLLSMLQDLSRGAAMDAVLDHHVGMTSEEIDGLAIDHLRAVLSMATSRRFEPNFEQPRDLDSLRRRVEAAPDDAEAHAQLAMGLLQGLHIDSSRTEFRQTASSTKIIRWPTFWRLLWPCAKIGWPMPPPISIASSNRATTGSPCAPSWRCWLVAKAGSTTPSPTTRRLSFYSRAMRNPIGRWPTCSCARATSRRPSCN
jgi:hypothetical protein